MEQPGPEVEPKFSRPLRQIVFMLTVLALTGALAVVALPRVLPVFQANPYLNGFIIFVFFIGVIACFWQVFQLNESVRWLKGFVGKVPGYETSKPPSLLAPLATLLSQRDSRMKIASGSASSILDSVAQRIDEPREITRYIVSLLIFLGLLGTFYGLATTVPAVVDTIRSLAPQEGEAGVDIFNRLMSGLEAQLGGMGVAFASSLLGLAGSLIVGLLELFAGHGQNRFYRELEEWVSTITRVGFAAGDGDGSPEAGMMAGVIDHMGEQMESLQMMLTQSDVNRSLIDEKLGALAASVEKLGDRMNGGDHLSDALNRVADGQERLLAQMEKGTVGEGIDAESRMRLRSIDVQMLRILEEISAGRQEAISDLRTDLSEIARSLAQANLSGQGTTPAPRAKLRRVENDPDRGT